MVSGYDKFGSEYTPPRHPRSLGFRLFLLLIFAASTAVGAWSQTSFAEPKPVPELSWRSVIVSSYAQAHAPRSRDYRFDSL
jgi:hypothetical protein